MFDNTFKNIQLSGSLVLHKIEICSSNIYKSKPKIYSDTKTFHTITTFNFKVFKFKTVLHFLFYYQD